MQRLVVRFDLPYSFELPDVSYKVVRDSYSVLANIKSNKRSGNVVGAPPNVVFAGDMTLMNDRWKDSIIPRLWQSLSTRLAFHMV